MNYPQFCKLRDAGLDLKAIYKATLNREQLPNVGVLQLLAFEARRNTQHRLGRP